ncbi:uncharacterized protein PV09_07214 [Verruconis gallopava]|uniref:SWIM-type domain-containing protein n=1 Tax=Verruconis gallopava TaxID=253628 RepID=A0A0D1YKW5_9PEZI|nr:uncharacterized protein PV09_07214 [Verruconis gallopava]KIW01457.1 hypothetical protein PV09_07214 [Verruconis gallopava]
MFQEQRYPSSSMALQFSSQRMSRRDTTIDYTMLPSDDIHTETAARKGVVNKYITLKKVLPSETGDALSFILQEEIIVEIGETDNTREGHDCSCADYSPKSPCSHVFWAVDQILRSQAGQNTAVTLSSDEGILRVSDLSGLTFDPTEFPPGIDTTHLQNVGQEHTDLKLRFKATLEREEHKLYVILTRLSNRNYVDLDVVGVRPCSASHAHAAISVSASNIFRSYYAYDEFLRWSGAPISEINAAAARATKTYLLMIKEVVVRADPNGLRRVASTAYYNEAGEDCFWYHVNRFFRHTRGPVGNDEAEALETLLTFVLGPTSTHSWYPRPTPADEHVIQAMESWLGR